MEHQEEASGQDKDTIEMPETYRHKKRRQTQAKKPTVVTNDHKGPMPTSFLTDAKKKSNALCSRKRTLMKKVDELVSRTHSEAYLHIVTPSKQNWWYGSHELKSKYDKLLMKQHGPMETQGIPAHTTTDDVVTVPFPSPPNRKTTTSVHVQTTVSMFRQSNKCAICHIESDGDGDTEKGPWGGCDAPNCDYWVHFLCQGYRVSKKHLSIMRKIPFYCDKHRHTTL